jgi:dihydrofolate reductase
MRHLSVFNQISLDGYFSGPNGDISWAKANQDPEWKDFVTENANTGGVFLFGRVTYELFEGVEDKKILQPTKTRTFGNGNVLLCYES